MSIGLVPSSDVPGDEHGRVLLRDSYGNPGPNKKENNIAGSINEREETVTFLNSMKCSSVFSVLPKLPDRSLHAKRKKTCEEKPTTTTDAPLSEPPEDERRLNTILNNFDNNYVLCNHPDSLICEPPAQTPNMPSPPRHHVITHRRLPPIKMNLSPHAKC